MNYITIIGMLAACFTTSAFIPQVIKAHKTKQTKDLSIGMFILLALGLILWTIYGVSLKSTPIILANTITLSLTTYLLYLKIKNG